MINFPKLPDQDDYLLDLQNNNYSMKTVYSYARDLCIFASFLRSHDTAFDQLDKKSITVFKGYLKNGDHLVDLNNFRENVARNAGVMAKSAMKLSRGSKTNEKDLEAGSIPLEDSKKVGASGNYLDDVYRKV